MLTPSYPLTREYGFTLDDSCLCGCRYAVRRTEQKSRTASKEIWVWCQDCGDPLDESNR